MTHETSPASPRGRFARRLPIIACLGMVLRLIAVLALPAAPHADFDSYESRGHNLLDTGVYGVVSGVPDATWPPLYPISLAAAFGIFGRDPIVGRLLGIALGGLLIVGLGLLGRALVSERVGLVTASIAALYPRLVLLPCLLASENLFGVLLVAWFLSMVASWKREADWKPAIFGGVLLGLTALSRAVAYPFAPLWIVASWVSGKRLRRALAEGLLLLAVQHVVMLPWAVRNARTLDGFSFTTASSGFSLYLGNSPEARGTWHRLSAESRPNVPGPGRARSFQQSSQYRDLAFEWMAENPRQAVALFAKKLLMMHRGEDRIVRLVLGPKKPPKGRRNAKPIDPPPEALYRSLWILSNGAYVLLLVGIALGLGLRLRRLLRSPTARRRSPETATLVALLGGAIALTLLGALFFGNPRFRWPAHDLLMPLAGVAVATTLTGKSKSKPPSDPLPLRTKPPRPDPGDAARPSAKGC